ncbi:MAG: hypothetical protein R2725_07715 [Solirubrobacterales bacterium]
MPVLDTSEIDRLREAVLAAAEPLRLAGRVDDQEVEETVAELRDRFSAAEVLAADTLDQLQQLSDQEESLRPEVLSERSDDLGGAFGEEARKIDGVLRAGRDRLSDSLQRARTPQSESDTGALLARREIELAIAQAEAPRESGLLEGDGPEIEHVLDVMVELAHRGGELAAAVASPWGRLILVSTHPGLEWRHREVVDAAIAAVDGASNDAERQQIAAASEAVPRLTQAIDDVVRELNRISAGFGPGRQAFGLRDARPEGGELSTRCRCATSQDAPSWPIAVASAIATARRSNVPGTEVVAPGPSADSVTTGSSSGTRWCRRMSRSTGGSDGVGGAEFFDRALEVNSGSTRHPQLAATPESVGSTETAE